MHRIARLAACVATVALLGEVPAHVQTSDYWMGYSGTKNVPAAVAARRLTWVETDNKGSALIAPFGVKTIMYTNPNRVQPGDPLYGTDEDEYAHTCGGQRARGESQYKSLVLTDPKSPRLRAMWQRSVDEHAEGGHFDDVFADEAVGTAYAQDQPCGYNFNAWLQAEAALFRSLRYPVIYNGLNDFGGHNLAPEITLNAEAAGGMMEECYAQLRADHRVAGWQWNITEQTELRMAQDRKYFFCYGRDLTPADQADDGRLYTYASFLLTYDPATTVLWEYYKTPSGGHVMPESQLVALDPVKTGIRTIDQLRTLDGVYMRSYRKCYIAGLFAGACVAAVNSDDAAHPVTLAGYKRKLVLRGSGVFDGGSIGAQPGPTPVSLPPRTAVIAFK